MLIGENLALPILALISHNDSNKIKVILIRSFQYFEFYEHLSKETKTLVWSVNKKFILKLNKVI